MFAWSTGRILSCYGALHLDWIPASKCTVEFIGRHEQHLGQAVGDGLALEQKGLPVPLQRQGFLEQLFPHGAQLARRVDQHFGNVVLSQKLLTETRRQAQQLVSFSLCATHDSATSNKTCVVTMHYRVSIPSRAPDCFHPS